MYVLFDLLYRYSNDTRRSKSFTTKKTKKHKQLKTIPKMLEVNVKDASQRAFISTAGPNVHGCIQADKIKSFAKGCITIDSCVGGQNIALSPTVSAITWNAVKKHNSISSIICQVLHLPCKLQHHCSLINERIVIYRVQKVCSPKADQEYDISTIFFQNNNTTFFLKKISPVFKILVLNKTHLS